MRRATASLCLLACLAFAGQARATYDPLGSGKTKLVLDKGFATFLAKDAIKLSAKNGARQKAATYTLPVTAGNLDPTIGKGEIVQTGTLVFQSRAKRLPLRDIRIQTKSAPLIAKAGGSQLKLAQGARLSSRRQGFGTSLKATHLLLSEKLVTRLNKKLRPKVPFEAGQQLGMLSSLAQPQLVSVEDKGKATLVFDPGFLARLEARFVSLNPVFPAEHQGATFTFPIAAGGLLSPQGTEGTLRTGGATEMLQLGGGQLFWQEQWLDLAAKIDSAEADLEPTPAFPGKTGRVGILDLSGGAFSADPGSRTLSLQGTQLSLSPDGAAQLNQAFAQGQAPAFSAGEAVGMVSFSAKGQ